MRGLLLLCVAFIAFERDGVRGDVEDDARVAAFKELRSLYSKTAEDSLYCAIYFWSSERKKACQTKQAELKKELMEKVREYWLKNKWLAPVDGKCSSGVGSFYLGLFADPVDLPCSDEAFVPPKHTDEEIDDMYRTLYKLFLKYDKVCLWSKSCEEGKKEAQEALMKKIKEAEDEGYIAKKCEPSGKGWYVFFSGMQETEMPCIYKEPSSELESGSSDKSGTTEESSSSHESSTTETSETSDSTDSSKSESSDSTDSSKSVSSDSTDSSKSESSDSSKSETKSEG